MSAQFHSSPSHLIDFSSEIPDSALPQRRRAQFGQITLTRGPLLPTPGIYLGSEQVIVARHCGPVVRLEWRSPDSDTLRAQPIARGVVHIKCAGQMFWQRWGLPADVLVIAFDRNFFTELSHQAADADIELIGELGVTDRRLAELTGLFDDELRDNGSNGRFYVENLGAALAAYLVQRRTNKPTAASYQSRISLAPSRLRRIIEYIDTHLTDDLGLTELSEVAGLNPHHFAHAFKETVGMPPHRFIVERRVDKARGLLEYRQQSIADIAIACGFANQSHFTEHFRRVVGTTPAKYRRSL